MKRGYRRSRFAVRWCYLSLSMSSRGRACVVVDATSRHSLGARMTRARTARAGASSPPSSPLPPIVGSPVEFVRRAPATSPTTPPRRRGAPSSYRFSEAAGGKSTTTRDDDDDVDDDNHHGRCRHAHGCGK